MVSIDAMVYSCGIFHLGHGLFSSFFRFCSLGLNLVLTGVWVYKALLGFLVRLRLGSMDSHTKISIFFFFLHHFYDTQKHRPFGKKHYTCEKKCVKVFKTENGYLNKQTKHPISSFLHFTLFTLYSKHKLVI